MIRAWIERVVIAVLYGAPLAWKGLPASFTAETESDDGA